MQTILLHNKHLRNTFSSLFRRIISSNKSHTFFLTISWMPTASWKVLKASRKYEDFYPIYPFYMGYRICSRCPVLLVLFLTLGHVPLSTYSNTVAPCRTNQRNQAARPQRINRAASHVILIQTRGGGLWHLCLQANTLFSILMHDMASALLLPSMTSVVLFNNVTFRQMTDWLTDVNDACRRERRDAIQRTKWAILNAEARVRSP